jgi:hypothetical protein
VTKSIPNPDPKIVALMAKALGITPDQVRTVLTQGADDTDEAIKKLAVDAAASICANTEFPSEAAAEDANADAAARMNCAIAPLLLNDPAWFDDGYIAAVPMALLGLFYATRMQREGLSDLAQTSAEQIQVYAKRIFTELDELKARGKLHPTLHLGVSLGLDKEIATRQALRAAISDRVKSKTNPIKPTHSSSTTVN